MLLIAAFILLGCFILAIAAAIFFGVIYLLVYWFTGIADRINARAHKRHHHPAD